ncbi:MAG TPA: hypothetical protein VEG68_00340 [Terriglobales bacterium]|nr:hypothetical protein [Terriglobales bacterium]
MSGELSTSESSVTQTPPRPEEDAAVGQFSERLAEDTDWDEGEDIEDLPEPVSDLEPDIWLYRDRTTALLWRYMRLAVEIGRLPSLLGREFFRARVSPYSAQTFENTVIFVHDVECCLRLLDSADRILIAMLSLEQRSQEEVARSLRCTQRTIGRHYAEALDRLSEIFLQREILARLPEKNTITTKACQEGETGEFLVSDFE